MGSSVRLPMITGLDVARVLERNGFERVRQKGNHLRLQKKENGLPLHVTIPNDRKLLKKGTLMGILHQANLSKDIFLDLLR